MTEVRYCPYVSPSPRICNLEAHYDTAALDDAVVEAITEDVGDTFIVDALTAAAGKVYRGSICLNCGAWFPAD
jgi:hypothetical protein